MQMSEHVIPNAGTRSKPTHRNRSQEMNVDESSEQFQLRPPLEKRFNPKTTNEIIHSVLSEELTGKTYKPEEAQNLCSLITTKVKSRLKGTIDSQYKLVCHAILGEARGAGIRVVARCLWDSENDAIASTSFENDSLYCVASVFAVFFY